MQKMCVLFQKQGKRRKQHMTCSAFCLRRARNIMYSTLAFRYRKLDMSCEEARSRPEEDFYIYSISICAPIISACLLCFGRCETSTDRNLATRAERLLIFTRRFDPSKAAAICFGGFSKNFKVHCGTSITKDDIFGGMCRNSKNNHAVLSKKFVIA